MHSVQMGRPHSEQSRTTIGGMTASEASQAEGADDSSHETADVSTLRNAANREREHEVDEDHSQSAPTEDVIALLLEHEPGSKDPEDRA